MELVHCLQEIEVIRDLLFLGYVTNISCPKMGHAPCKVKEVLIKHTCTWSLSSFSFFLLSFPCVAFFPLSAFCFPLSAFFFLSAFLSFSLHFTTTCYMYMYESRCILPPLASAAGLVFVGYTCTVDVGVYSPSRMAFLRFFI